MTTRAEHWGHAASAALGEGLVVEGSRARLQFIQGGGEGPWFFDQNGCVMGTVWLLVMEDGQIASIKEQSVALLTGPVPLDSDRLANLIRGWAVVLREVLSSADVDPLMPHDVCGFTSAARLQKARSPEDFEKAFRARSRLGRLLD